MNCEVLRLEAVAKKTAGRQVLQDIWLSALAGEITGVFGMHGEGKEALVHLLTGRTIADKGRFFWNGQLFANSNWQSLTNSGKTAFIHQEERLVEAFTVAENLFLMQRGPCWFRMVKKEELEKQAAQLFRECGLSISPARETKLLEPPERMMLEILSALCHGVQLLVLDDSVRKLLWMRPDYPDILHGALQKTNAAMVLISDSPELMISLCDQVTVIQKGITIKILPRDRVSTRKLERYLNTELPIRAERVQQKSKGREVLSCKDLQTVVRDKFSPPLSFSVHLGEILGIVALDDDWNFSLVNALSGRAAGWKGEILRAGHAVSPAFLYHQANKKNPMCVLYGVEAPMMITGLSLEENFMLPVLRKISGVFGCLGRSVGRFADRHLKSCGITDEGLTESPEERVRLTMERVKLFGPELLIVLEQGELLDSTLKNFVKSELTSIAETAGVLLVSSAFSDLQDICERLVLVRQGQVVFAGRTDEIREGQLLKYLLGDTADD